MEKYLRKVGQEFERESAHLIKVKQTVVFSDLDRLCKFNESSDKKDLASFEVNFATPHDKVIQLISENTYSGMH